MILPPGMQKALSSLRLITLTSHFQPGASFLKIAVWGLRRVAIVRTRLSKSASWFSHLLQLFRRDQHQLRATGTDCTTGSGGCATAERQRKHACQKERIQTVQTHIA
jgi:hypothetical protein